MFTRLWVVVRGWGQTRATGIAPSVVVEIVELAISLPDVGSGVGCCDVETMDDVVPEGRAMVRAMLPGAVVAF